MQVAGYCATIIHTPVSNLEHPLPTGCKHQGICGPGIVWCPTYTRQYCWLGGGSLSAKQGTPRYRSIRLEADSPEQQGSKNSKLDGTLYGTDPKQYFTKSLRNSRHETQPRAVQKQKPTATPRSILRGGSVNYVIRITCAIKMYGNRFHHCTPRLLSKR